MVKGHPYKCRTNRGRGVATTWDKVAYLVHCIGKPNIAEHVVLLSVGNVQWDRRAPSLNFPNSITKQTKNVFGVALSQLMVIWWLGRWF